MKKMGLTKCGHIFCQFCCKDLCDSSEDNKTLTCPMCRAQMTKKEVLKLQKDKELTLTNEQKEIPAAKISCVIDKIKQTLEDNPDDKIVIFTYFKGTQDIIKYFLEKKNGFNKQVAVLNGSLNTKDKARAIESFDKPKIRIFLSTLTAGNVGLNLVQANHCIITSPWWNPSTELQAEESTFLII